MLWDNGQDWNKISEFDFFCVFATSLTPDKTGILFGDLDFSKFRLATKNETGETVLYNEELDFAIDSFIYHHMISYVRRINGMTYTGTKIIKGATAKKLVIERAVSYTHLQREEILNAEKYNNLRDTDEFKALVENMDPVSSTHLDVYKRQVQRLGM